MNQHIDLLIVIVIATAVASGAWLGWSAGRHYEKSRQLLRHMRKRRPLTIKVDYDLAVRALNNSGYRVEKQQQEQVH